MSAFPHPRILLGAAALLLASHAAADHVKVFLMGGQSNMYGNSCLIAGLPSALQGSQPDVMYYPGSLKDLGPTYGDKFGPEISFGRTVEDAFPSETFCLIKYAVNGSSLLVNWNPTTGGSYAGFNSRVQSGITALTNAGHSYEIVGMLWTQGEAEASNGTTTPVYQAALNEFIADVRTRYGPNLPFFVSRLSSAQTSIAANGLNSIRAAQEYVATNDPYTYLVDTDGIKPNTDPDPEVNTDRLHFNAAGQVKLGQAFGASYAASVVPDVTAPEIALLSPANGSTDHPATNNLVINFSEPIVLGTGSITIRKSSDGTAVESFDVANPPANLSLNLSGATLTLDLSSNLNYSTGYYVEIAPTAIADNSGNLFAGLSGPSGWSFTTAAGQVGGLIAGSGITVTASSINSTGKYPVQSVVNGAGLNTTTGVHGSGGNSEWNTNNGQNKAEVWISFDLGGSYVLDSMHVWNMVETPNNGIQNLDIYVSDAYAPGDPEGAGSANWTKIGNNVGFATGGASSTGFDLETQTGITLPTTAVRHVRFEVNTNFGGGYVGLAEVQFFAAPSGGPDTTAPAVSSLNPANGASAVTSSGNLEVNFSEPVVFGTGFITIRKTAGGAVFESYNVASPPANLTLSGSKLTINPTADFAASTGYYVEIDMTAIDDASGNSFAGISGSSAWNFTTLASDTTAPTISNLNPANGATAVASAGNLEVTFSEPVVFGTGFITIRKTAGGALVESYDVASPPANLTLSGSKLTINPSADFAAFTGHYVEIDATAIDDASGNSFAGISGSSVWGFTTLASDTTAPTISNLNPANGATAVASAGNLEVTFSEPVVFGTGFITIRKTAGGTLVESYNVASPPANLTLSGSKITINPSADFAASTGYYVEIDTTAIDDASGNSFAGISGGTSWGFTTAAGQTGGMIAGSGITVTASTFNGVYSPDGKGVVNGAGLNANNEHSAAGGDREWYTSNGQGNSDTFISFDLGAAVVLDSIHVWNATQYPNFGIKQLDIYVSSLANPGDPEGAGAADWTHIGTNVSFVQAGSPNVGFDLETQTGITLPATAIRHVRFESNNNFGGTTNYVGLSEVQFFAAGVSPGDSFADWIGGFNVGGQTGFNDDYDHDGLGNAVENLMGTSPEGFNPGLTSVSANGGNLVFRHTLSATPASDLTGSYEWSANLVDWNASGASAGGTIVTFGTPVVITPGTPNLVEVTASVIGTPTGAIFARYKATKN